MALDVPEGMDVRRVVLLLAADLNLLETPLREHSVRRAEITARGPVAEAQAGRERVDALVLVLGATVDVVDDLYDPIVLVVADGRVTVARHFIVELGNWRWDRV